MTPFVKNEFKKSMQTYQMLMSQPTNRKGITTFLVHVVLALCPWAGIVLFGYPSAPQGFFNLRCILLCPNQNLPFTNQMVS